MTAIATFRTELMGAIQTQLLGVQVLPAPPGEDTALRESVWIEELISEFDWRCIGPAANNRKEIITGELRVHVYREGSDQVEVAAAVLDRLAEICSLVEDAFEADFSLSGAVTYGLPKRWSQRVVAYDKGWAGDGRVTLESDNYP